MKRAEKDFVVIGMASIVPLTAVPDELAGRLSPADRERAARFRRPEDRARFVVGRALLAKLLRDELDHRPAVLELALTEHGRPHLPTLPDVHFSISHAGDWVAVALGVGVQVGIDVESLDRRVDLTALAERIFNPDDLARFRTLPETEKPRAFFRAWTGKEAVLKAKGLGLFGGVQDISVPLDDESEAVPDPAAGRTVWHLHAVPVAAGYLASLACQRPVPVSPPRLYAPDRLA